MDFGCQGEVGHLKSTPGRHQSSEYKQNKRSKCVCRGGGGEGVLVESGFTCVFSRPSTHPSIISTTEDKCLSGC